MSAATNGHTNVVKRLVQERASVNMQNKVSMITFYRLMHGRVCYNCVQHFFHVVVILPTDVF